MTLPPLDKKMLETVSKKFGSVPGMISTRSTKLSTKSSDDGKKFDRKLYRVKSKITQSL